MVALFVVFGAATASGAEAGKGVQSYVLAPGDRVTVTVFGQPELSGDFVVDGAGNVSLALIGAVPAADATVAQVQERVVDRLADGYMQEPKVSVRISELRPIYILGDVRSPGSYPYRHGLSVLNAMALAGGVRVIEERQELLRGEVLQAEERVRVLSSNLNGLLARRSRLTAQRDGADQISFPASLLAGNSSDPLLDEILEGERTILLLQRMAQTQELQHLRQQFPRIRSEVDAIGSQRRLERMQLELIQSQLGDTAKLMSSGLARRANVIELQREQARIEGNIARYTADAAKAEQALGEAELKLQDAENGYKRRIVGELQETIARIMEVGASLSTAREALAIVLHRAGLAAGRVAQGPTLTVAVTRYAKGDVKTFSADETTSLYPGDIVRIDLMALRPSAASAVLDGAAEGASAPALADPAALASSR